MKLEASCTLPPAMFSRECEDTRAYPAAASPITLPLRTYQRRPRICAVGEAPSELPLPDELQSEPLPQAPPNGSVSDPSMTVSSL